MGFDANQFRAQQAKPESGGGSLVNIVLASLLGLGVLAVVYMYFFNIKRNNAHSDKLHAARLASVDGAQGEEVQSAQVPGLRSSSPTSKKLRVKAAQNPKTQTPKPQSSAQLTYVAQIDVEMQKYNDTSKVLRSCGKRAEYARQYYINTNSKKYWALYKIHDSLPKKKRTKSDQIVPDSMTKSWDRLGKIKDEKDVAVFLLKGGAIKHQMAAMEMMSNMEKMNQGFREDKKKQAAARTPKACMVLARKVQQGKLNVRVPKKKRT
jgi:hypothetical protein